MSRAAILLAIILVASPLVGCIRKADDGVDAAALEQKKADEILGSGGNDKLVDAAAIIPKNYSFPGQNLLPQVVKTFAASVAQDAIGGYEAERDEGGIDYNTKTVWFDVGDLLPEGQPAELVLKLYWDASEINSADLDIAIDVPGTKTTHHPTSETWNWNIAVKTVVVDTIGVAGQNARVGVQVASAIVSQGFDFKLDVTATYVKDVLTPYHAWGLDVPQGAGGILLESEKAGGDEHITSQFILIDPEDNLIAFVDFNDISIPTQSVFIPVSKAGEYVFYAYFMHGGFLRAKADVPVAENVARTLSLVEKEVVDSNSPQPGIAGKDFLNGTADGTVPLTDANPVVVQFSPEGAFPLRVSPFVKGQVVTSAKIILSSPLGVVAEQVVYARYEDDRGTIGYTNDEDGSVDKWHDWSKIAKGTWTAEIVNNNPAVEVGHSILSYTR